VIKSTTRTRLFVNSELLLEFIYDRVPSNICMIVIVLIYNKKVIAFYF
jgi:hypothetical protein